jgi:hypothetical protein
MTGTFKCNDCDLTFEAKGKKEEWKDPVFGFCWRYVSACPECNEDVGEYRPPKPQKDCCKEGNCSSCGGSCSC